MRFGKRTAMDRLKRIGLRQSDSCDNRTSSPAFVAFWRNFVARDKAIWSLTGTGALVALLSEVITVALSISRDCCGRSGLRRGMFAISPLFTIIGSPHILYRTDFNTI